MINSNAYDEVHYEDEYFPNTHPNYLGAVATLYGLSPEIPKKCRMLEFGAARGNNLIEIAKTLPDSEFVGIDLSLRQVDEGNKKIKQLGLSNLRLEHRNILDLGLEYGKFDYIIAHGLLSWVPDEVRRKMFWLCNLLLTENGICYFSYNTYPGWKGRDVFREMMLFEAGDISDIKLKVEKSRNALEKVNLLLGENNTSFSKHLAEELGYYRSRPDWYYVHDFLADINHPFYIKEIFDFAKEAGMQYFSDTELSMNTVLGLPEKTQKLLLSLKSDILNFEQYSDIARLRAFRRSLFCREGREINRNISKNSLFKLSILADFEKTKLEDQGGYRFSTKTGAAIVASDEVLIKALDYVKEKFPCSVPVKDLVSNLYTLGLADKENSMLDGIAKGILANIFEISIC